MRVAIDTNAYVALCKGERWAVEYFQIADQIAIPFIVLAELKAGFACGVKGRQNERELSKFLASKRVNLLWADDDTLFVYSALFAQLRKSGTPIPTNDLWIASLVIQASLPLVTADSHFAQIPQLLVLGSA